MATWPAYEDLSFAVIEDDRVVAIVPCYLRSGNAIECLGGPAVDGELTQVRRRDVLEWIHARLRVLAQQNGADAVDMRISQMAPAFHLSRSPTFNPLLEFGYQDRSSQTYVIDLSLSENEIFSAMRPYCRTHIRKAIKEGCSIEIAPATNEALDIYYDLHCRTYERTGVSPHPRSYFRAIWKEFVARGQAIVFFAVQNGNVIAADNEIFFKGAMSGWTAAGLPAAARVGANNLLHWRAMQWSKAKRATIYESGEGFPKAVDGKSKGLNDFKKSFGGKLFPIYRGSLSVERASSANKGGHQRSGGGWQYFRSFFQKRIWTDG